MLTPSDLICLPYTQDLTQAGIAWLCQELTRYPHSKQSNPSQTHCTVAAKASALAFRRCLNGLELPPPGPGRAEFQANGRRFELVPVLIDDTNDIERIRKDPANLLQREAAAPVSQLDLEYLPGEEILVFAFILGLVAETPARTARAHSAGQPVSLLFPIPSHWNFSVPGRVLGSLVLKTDLADPISMELGGLDENQNYQSEEINLPARQRIQAKKSYACLSYLLCHHPIRGQVGLHALKLSKTWIIQPTQWTNAWVYGQEIVLAGCLSRAEFRHKSRPFHSDGKHGQPIPAGMKLASLPLHDLHPLRKYIHGS